MSNENIIELVKELLDVKDELPLNQLRNMLWEKRNSYHPDQYRDDNVKNEVTEKFKELSNVYEQLEQYMEAKSLEKKVGQIIPWQENYTITQDRLKIIANEEELRQLRMENQFLKNMNDNLEKILQEMREDKIKEKTLEVIELFKPSTKSTMTLGAITIFSLALAIFGKIEEVTKVLFKYSSVNVNTFNSIIFWILIITVLLLFKNYIEIKTGKQLAKEISSLPFVSGFAEYLKKEDEKKREFDEEEIYNYLEIKLNKGKYGILLNSLFYFEKTSLLSSLTELFIYNLLHKKLIEPYGERELKKRFKISFRYY